MRSSRSRSAVVLSRQLLNMTRADRLSRVGERVGQVVPRIPVTGWPGGLFGRRDALLLTLAATGLGFEEIARLRRTDVTTERDALVVKAGEGWVRVATESGVEPVVVYRNWVEVLGFLDRYPSAKLLAGRLDKGASLSVFADSARRDEQPLFTPIDRWGHTPYDPTPLTGHSIAALVRAHLAGSAPVHKRPPAWQPPTKSGEDAPVPVVVDDVELDQATTNAASPPAEELTPTSKRSPTSSTASKTKPTNSSLICWRSWTSRVSTKRWSRGQVDSVIRRLPVSESSRRSSLLASARNRLAVVIASPSAWCGVCTGRPIRDVAYSSPIDWFGPTETSRTSDASFAVSMTS